MLTFRKALFIAVFVLTCLYLFGSYHSSPRPAYTTSLGHNGNGAGSGSTSTSSTTGSTSSTTSSTSSSSSAKQQQQQPGSSTESTARAAADSNLPGKTKESGKKETGSGRAAAEPARSSAPKADNGGGGGGSTSPSTGRNAQKPMGVSSGSLLDRLQFQYPYDSEGKFPAYIWQTWKATPASGQFADRLRPFEASWTEQHPTFVHEVITDDIALNLVRYLYASVPEVIDAYEALPLPVLRADFFRYLILLARGGIYSDIDTIALKPATDWLPGSVPPSSVGLIVGIEADPDRPDWAQWYSRRIQFCQWTIQAKVGHPVLRSIVAQIADETLRMKRAGLLAQRKLDTSIVEFTGPARWTDTVFAYFNSPRYFKIEDGAKNISWEAFTNIEKPKRVGDVVVLPITSFSPGVQQMGAKEIDDPMAFVKHEFEGSWKQEWEHVKPILDTVVHAEKSEKPTEPDKSKNSDGTKKAEKSEKSENK